MAEGIRASAYLIALRPDALVGIVLDVAQRDDRLYQSLLVKADRSAGGGNLSETLHQAIDRATQIDDFVDWREAGTFAGKFDQATDSPAELLKPATAAMLVDLAEYAMARAENALEHIDDSSGEMGEIISTWVNCISKLASWRNPIRQSWPNTFSV